MNQRPGLAIHHYVEREGWYDVDKMRAECIEKRNGDYYSAPVDAHLHFHKYDEKCGQSCEHYFPKGSTNE